MNLRDWLPRASDYLARADLSSVLGWRPGETFCVALLAQGEYNMNYLVRQGERAWVLRVNVGTQIGRADQILYEYRASGCWSRPASRCAPSMWTTAASGWSTACC